MDLNWGEGFEREGLGGRGGHGRMREREQGDGVTLRELVRERERFK